jgi:hypothetical protein
MHNLSDEELDRLSREAAEVNQTPVSPSGWDTISSRLDKEMPVPYKDKTWYLRIITDLLLLLTFTYIGTQYPSAPSKQSAINISSGQPVSERQSAAAEQAGNGIKTDPSKAASSNNISENNVTDNLKLSDGKKSSPEENSKVGPAALQKNDDSKGNKRGTVLNQKNHPGEGAATENQTVIEKSLKSADVSGASKKNDDGSVAKADNPKSVVEEPNQVASVPAPAQTNMVIPPVTSTKQEDLAPAKKSDPAVEESSVQTDSAVAQVAEKNGQSKAAANGSKKKSKQASIDGISKNALQIGLTWSPDFSKVGTSKPVDYGQTMGITAGYQISKRWSVQTAVLYTNKYYTTVGGTYGKVPGYPPSDPYLKIKQVNAECFMWDIPLNIRYDWLAKRRSRAFVSAGFSSYFMKKEDLHYWYTHYNNPKYKHWINESNSNYWFAVGNISAGFEQFITPSISIQVEPFFKFSLRDVGYGQVNLKSSGIFLGVKYTPPLHLSKK